MAHVCHPRTMTKEARAALALIAGAVVIFTAGLVTGDYTAGIFIGVLIGVGIMVIPVKKEKDPSPE